MGKDPLKAVLSISILALILLTPLLVVAESLPYKEGDWATYKVTVNMGGVECVYRVRLTIKSVDNTNVKYSLALEELVKGDEQKCQLATALLMMGLAIPSNIKRDVSTLTPESGAVLINPSYTGQYTTSDGFKASYVKGVLTLLEGESTDIIVIRIRVELVDTNMPFIQPNRSTHLLITAGLAAIVILAILLLIIKKLRRRKQPPQNQYLFPPRTPESYA